MAKEFTAAKKNQQTIRDDSQQDENESDKKFATKIT